MIENLDLSKIFFIDIETVPQYSEFEEMPENFQKHWDKKSSHFRELTQNAADVYHRAGIYSEFGKIVCISLGFIHNNNFRSKSFAGVDEKEILINFAELLNDPKHKDKFFCGHNIKEFDIPYICRRMLINGIKLPFQISIFGKKPWEISNLDTMDLWKFGDYKNFTSLALLADIFDIPTSKDDIDGSQVAEVFYKEKNIERIAIYCEKDVLCTANLLLRFLGKPILTT
ncbi:MAG: 3'-5' exonuclease [Bacteroidales bacterium]|jgi:DNA polymerase elongation subunit (family B)|nr:3'-5' exonuclease [Bacteroidales bacterium]